MTQPSSEWARPPGSARALAEGIVVREYRGKPAKATIDFQDDAIVMAGSDYYPISQAYHQGQWGAVAFIVALLLCLVLIGILPLIYMLLVKPAGSMLVTYQWRPPVASRASAVA